MSECINVCNFILHEYYTCNILVNIVTQLKQKQLSFMKIQWCRVGPSDIFYQVCFVFGYFHFYFNRNILSKNRKMVIHVECFQKKL